MTVKGSEKKVTAKKSLSPKAKSITSEKSKKPVSKVEIDVNSTQVKTDLSDTAIPINKLSRKLGYTFKDIALLAEAITHRSKHSINNERLEFLGDSVLGYVISSELFRCFPDATEGELTRGRALLVRGETLAELALDMNLGEYLQLGPGELKSGGYRRKSILSDAMEAIIGAIYIDGGLEPARQHILSIYADKLETISLKKVSKDPKTQLQETMQAMKSALPCYEIVATSGSDHDQVFEVTCKISEIPKPVKGSGTSRRKAEQDAAKKVLKILADGS
jgi:ribonuclease-3